MTRLKQHFATEQAQELTAEGAEQLKNQMKEKLGDQAAQLDDEMLAQISKTQMVQPVALMPGGPHNGFTHTNMYVDDQGGLKGLPNNRRATELAMAAGGMHDVRGDAFLGRIVDDGNDLYHRLSFTLSEVANPPSAMYSLFARLWDLS